MTTVLAKFICTSVTENQGGSKVIELSATTGNAGDNKDFTDYTPSGTVKMFIAPGKPAGDYFKPGSKYFLEFKEEVPEETNAG